ALIITGASTFIVGTTTSNIVLDHASNAFSNSVTMKAGTSGNLAFGNIGFVDSAAVVIQTSADTNANGELLIDGSTDGVVGGTLSIKANGDITQNIDLAVAGTTTLEAGSNAITLNRPDNNFSTVIITSGGDVALRDAGAIILGAATVTGTYAVTAGGAVTNSGTQEITGITTISASGYNVTLDETTNNFAAAVKITGAVVTVVDENAINLGASTVTGTYHVTATAGDITNTGALIITGAST
ncbi:uncharacterized protein METZ01_LOCUS483679, partial [marine metagenome]